MGIYDEGDDDPYPQLNTSKHIDQAPVDTVALKKRIDTNNRMHKNIDKDTFDNNKSPTVQQIKAERSFLSKAVNQTDSLYKAREGTIPAK